MPVTNIDNKALIAAGKTNKPEAIKLYKVDDDTLRDWAWQRPKKELGQVSRNAAKVIMVATPLTDIFLQSVSKNGSLSKKAVEAAKATGRWGAVLGAVVALSGAKQFAYNHSQKLNDFGKKHPFLTFVSDCSAVLGLYVGALFGLNKLSKKTKTASFEKAKNIVNEALNNSSVNKKLVKPLDNFLKTHPYSNRALKFTAFVAAPVMMISSYLRYKNEVKSAIETADFNYKNLSAINSVLPEKVEEEA